MTRPNEPTHLAVLEHEDGTIEVLLRGNYTECTRGLSLHLARHLLLPGAKPMVLTKPGGWVPQSLQEMDYAYDHDPAVHAFARIVLEWCQHHGWVLNRPEKS